MVQELIPQGDREVSRHNEDEKFALQGSENAKIISKYELQLGSLDSPGPPTGKTGGHHIA